MEGGMSASIAQNPVLEDYVGVEMAGAAVKGPPLMKGNGTESQVGTQENGKKSYEQRCGSLDGWPHPGQGSARPMARRVEHRDWAIGYRRPRSWWANSNHGALKQWAIFTCTRSCREHARAK